MLFGNCHLHSTFSDGAYEPWVIAEKAKELGYGAVVLTDHDTVRGSCFLQREARKRGMLSLLGCEFSTQVDGEGVHLLAYDFNPYHPEMRALLKRAAAKEASRSRWLFEYGVKRGSLRPGVTWEEVEAFHPNNDYLCNNHLFAVYAAKGIYRPEEYKDFFMENFSGRAAGPFEEEILETTGCRVPALAEVIRVVRAADGVPVVAHPTKQKDLAGDMIRMGALGFEVRHPMLKEGEPEFFFELCEKHGLYKLGGTDHYAVLGGFLESMPWHDVPPERGYVSEAEFMDLYLRKKG